MKVYVKLRNGTWMLIVKKIEQTSISGKRRVTKSILAGESVKGPPDLPDNELVKVPATVVNKVISKLLDVEGSTVAIVEPLDADYCVVKVPKGQGRLVKSALSEVFERKRQASAMENKETS